MNLEKLGRSLIKSSSLMSSIKLVKTEILSQVSNLKSNSGHQGL